MSEHNPVRGWAVWGKSKAHLVTVFDGEASQRTLCGERLPRHFGWADDAVTQCVRCVQRKDKEKAMEEAK